jgi:hypothetical protein
LNLAQEIVNKGIDVNVKGENEKIFFAFSMLTQPQLGHFDTMDGTQSSFYYF